MARSTVLEVTTPVSLNLTASNGETETFDYEAKVKVRYYPGCAATYMQPGESATTEVLEVLEIREDISGEPWRKPVKPEDTTIVDQIEEFLEESDSFDEAVFDAVNGEMEYAREQAADARRDERMMGDFQ